MKITLKCKVKKEGQNNLYQVKQLNELFKAQPLKSSCWLVSFTKQPMNSLCNHSKILPKYRRTQRRESFFNIQKSNSVILYDCLRRCGNIDKVQTHFQYQKRKTSFSILIKSTYKLPLLSVIFYDISLNISFKINNNTEMTLTLEIVAVIQT